MIVMTEICFLRCCSSLTHNSDIVFWVDAKQCQTGYGKKHASPFTHLLRGVKVFQMFGALPFIKPNAFQWKGFKVKDTALFK